METLKTEHADAELVPIYGHDRMDRNTENIYNTCGGVVGGVYTQTINKEESGPRLDCTDVSIRGDPRFRLTFG